MQQGVVKVLCPSGAKGREAVLPLPFLDVAALRQLVQQQFGDALPAQFILTDLTKDFVSDEDVAQLKDGATLVVVSAKDRALAGPARERISFQPHPKTMTMSGDYEYYWCSRGRHPFVYALAEFIDNSLHATRKNAPKPRSIDISLVLTGNNPSTARGLVCIADNGCGMSKQELNEWAVMNYSMEERGKAPQEPEVQGRGGGTAGGAGRFLTGDLSYFGVGSKNAAFFMGSTVKLVTKRAEGAYVHELTLAADALEERYKNQQAVYEEDMVHRNPGDASTLADIEQPFGVTRAWVQGEASAPTAGQESFTRVLVGDLKPEVLALLLEDTAGDQICQELAHLYHYYLHGEGGNRQAGPLEGRLPNGEPFPEITLRQLVDAREVWSRKLAEVDDDLETRYLRAQKAELSFSLDVPGKGTVCGVLHYFPYENDRETMPLEAPAAAGAASGPFPSPPPRGALTQAGPSQMPRATQRMTQQPKGGNAGREGAGDSDADDEPEVDPWQAPIFEAFWQGRLIPGARIETLPFMEAVRQKRNAQTKDLVPDEAFRRLRGALFFGPAFRVTRNKLLFRDNLQELLATAVPGDRSLERKFREWLGRCHATLDKTIRFEAVADSRTQATFRAKLGEGTSAFERITDGTRTIAKGSVVRINVKPLLVGRVLAFTIPQVVKDEGCYPGGRVHVELLPPEVHGPGCRRDFSLRRIDGGPLEEKELAEVVNKELLKVPSCVRLVEPLQLATGKTLELSAGDALPETTISVLNGAGQKMTRGQFAGERAAVVVTQRLWRLPDGSPDAEFVPLVAAGIKSNDPTDEEVAAARPNKKARKGRKFKAAQEATEAEARAAAAAAGGQDENVDPGGNSGTRKPGGQELVLCVTNKSPSKAQCFQFAQVVGGLQRAGQYVLEYCVAPAPPGQEPLSLLVRLFVKPGPPVSLSISGEGKAVAALKEFALGEELPPLKLTFKDALGNPVVFASTEEEDAAASPAVSIYAATLGDAGQLVPCSDLEVTAQQGVEGSSIVLSGIQVAGTEEARQARQGLQIFSGTPCATRSTAPAAQLPPSQQAVPTGQVLLCLKANREQGGEEGWEPKTLAIRLRPGAPRALQLLPGHPWDQGDTAVEDAPLAALTLQSAQELPSFQVAAYDSWGNPTAPTEALNFSLLAKCPLVAPAAMEFPFNDLGIASVQGLTAQQAGVRKPLKLALRCTPDNPSMEAAVAAAKPVQELRLPLEVEACALPAAIQLLWNDEPLPLREVPGEEGPMMVACISGVVAGTQVQGLRMQLVDESGAPARQAVAGKLTASWKKGCKKVAWDGQPVKLPSLPVPQSLLEQEFHWLQFTGDSHPLTLDLSLEVRPEAAAPKSWKGAIDSSGQEPSQGDGREPVRCGEPFLLRVEAVDEYGNKCPGGAQQLIPPPIVSVLAAGTLEYNEQEWEQGWATQGGEEVYTVRMRLAGQLGEFDVHICDAGGEGGASLLDADDLHLQLVAGPPASLCIDGAGAEPQECGMRAVLHQLCIRVCDLAGNPTTSSSSFEVSLSNSALSVDGSGAAASVAVPGGNKVKLKGGVAVFKEVRVVADHPGTYALRVQGASRKVAVQDGLLQLHMAAQNVVRAVGVMLPEELEEGCQAGCAAELYVGLETEDGQPLAPEAAAAGLSLKVTPPGAASPTVVALPVEEGEGAHPTAEGFFAFPLGELTAAGTYTAVAEYTESRTAVLAGLPKKEAVVRSSTAQLQVLPAPAVTLSLEAPGLRDKLTATNGQASKQRLLIQNTAVQLRDAFGNAAACSGVQVRFRLRHAQQGAEQGGELPQLEEGQPGGGGRETDAQGRAFFGNLLLAQGTGRASASGSLECQLVCEALGLYPSASHELEMDEEGWALCWSRPLLFADDGAKYAAMEQLNSRRAEIAAEREGLQGRLQQAQQEVQGAAREQQRLAKALASRSKALPSGAPATAQEARERAETLVQEQEKAAEVAAAPVRPGKYGPANQAITHAINKILQSGDEGVVGVVARLATIDDEPLARILSAQYRSMLGVVTVADMPCRERMAKLVAQHKFPVPDMLALSQAVPHRGPAEGEIPGFAGAGPLAKRLVHAACAGTDKPIPSALPHAKAINNARERGTRYELGAEEWPHGCLGYAYNLVRPVALGHRAGVLAGLLGPTLVFETLAEAAAYREFMTQKLKMGLADIVCLDGGKITGRGIVCGSSFQPPPLDRTDYCFGATPHGQSPGLAEGAAELEALREWAELAEQKEAADASVAQAREAAQGVEKEVAGELGRLEGRLADLDAQLQGMPGGASVPAKRSRGGSRSPQVAAERRDEGEEQEGGGGRAKRRRTQRAK